MDVLPRGDTTSLHESDRDTPGESFNPTRDASTAFLGNGDLLSSQGDNKFQSAISAWRSTGFKSCPQDTVTLIIPYRYRSDQARPRTRFYSYRYCYTSARCFIITQRFGTKDKGFQEAGRRCQTGRVQGSPERYRSHVKAQNHCLLKVNSIPDVHRPPYESWKDYLFRLPADLLFHLRSPRSVPIT